MRCNAILEGMDMTISEQPTTPAVTTDDTPLCARESCRKPFKRKKKWQIYCSQNCRWAEWDSRNPRQRPSLAAKLNNPDAA